MKVTTSAIGRWGVGQLTVVPDHGTGTITTELASSDGLQAIAQVAMTPAEARTYAATLERLAAELELVSVPSRNASRDDVLKAASLADAKAGLQLLLAGLVDDMNFGETRSFPNVRHDVPVDTYDVGLRLASWEVEREFRVTVRVRRRGLVVVRTA